MSDSRDDDRGDRSPGQTAVACGLAVLVASLIPVSWVAPGRGGRGSDGGAGSGAVDAFPLDIGLTDPFHLVGYAILTVLAGRASRRGPRGLLLAAGAAVAFGFGIELLQAPIPWRSFGWDDAAVNAVGAAIGGGIAGAARSVPARSSADAGSRKP